MKTSGILAVLLMTVLMADLAYFERDVNVAQLAQCKAFFKAENDVKTIYLLNGEKLEFKDEFLNNDKEYKILLYTLKGCFFKEKYLIYSDFMPDSEAYHAIDLRNGNEIELDGMPHLSPNQHYFVTEADESRLLSVYTLSEERIVKVFFHRVPEHCVVQHTLWLDDQSLSFEVECDGLFDSDTNTTKAGTKETLKLIQKNLQWEIKQP